MVALAEQVVRCDDPRFTDLPNRLLHDTLIVRDLPAARAIASLDAGFRCITLQGELLEADGTLTVGTHHAEAGILSRKSELRELREQEARLDLRLSQLERDLADLRDRVSLAEKRLRDARQESSATSQQIGEKRLQISEREQARSRKADDVTLHQSEMSSLDQEIDQRQTSWLEKQEQAVESAVAVQAAHQRLKELDSDIRDHDARRRQLQQDSTACQVALGQVSERLKALKKRQEQLESDHSQRVAEQAQERDRLLGLQRSLLDCQFSLLRGSAALAYAYLRKEQARTPTLPGQPPACSGEAAETATNRSGAGHAQFLARTGRAG